MSLNRLPTVEKLPDKRKGNPASQLSKMPPKEYVGIILQRVIESAVEQSIIKSRIVEVHQFVVEFFGNSIESSITLDLLSSKAPQNDIVNLNESHCLIDNEPITLEVENWNRGCVATVERPPTIMKFGNQVSVAEDDISSISFYGSDNNQKRRTSQNKLLTRPSLISNRPSRVNFADSILKAPIPIQEEPVKVKDEEIQATSRLSISNISKRLIKLSQARSMSINSEKLEEELRQTKLAEFISSSQIRQSIFARSKKNPNNKGRLDELSSDDKVMAGNKQIERTFGLTGELQEIKALKNDKIKSILQHPKSVNKRIDRTQ